MISELIWGQRLKRMNDVSPALKVVALAALPGARRKTRRRIVAAIRNTAELLADVGSIKDAEDAIKEARAQSEAESIHTLGELDAEQPPDRPSVTRSMSDRSLAGFAERRGFERRALDALNDLLGSIGRESIDDD